MSDFVFYALDGGGAVALEEDAVGGGGAIEYASQMTGSGSDRYLNIRIGGLTAGRNQELEVTSSDGASRKFTVYVTN